MQHTDKRRILLALAACLTALLSACALLPEEEQPKAAPLIRTYEREAFALTFVERGDMTLSQRISCVYVPVQSAAMRFPLGGEYVDEVFVRVGDSVAEGQLLAQLRLEGVEERIQACERGIEALELRIDYLEKARVLAAERERVRCAEMDAAARAEALAAVNREYDGRRQALEDSVHIQSLYLKDLAAQLADRQLRAPFAGTVTYAKKFEEGAVSVADERVVTVADSTLSLFRTQTEYWPFFAPGMEFTITVSKAEYRAVVTDEARLGLREQEKTEGKSAYVYFMLKEPTFDLEDGDRGTLTLVLDERHDVLMVKEGAISTASGQTIVYYQNEEGMKAYKPVEIGLIANKMAEVVSGLEEGESVIVD